MILTNIFLANFRNIEKLDLSLNDHITILYGDNGQGKTNIVEAIYALANGLSFRTSYFKQMILNGKEEANVVGTIKSEKRVQTHSITFTSSGKIAKINDLVVNRLVDYIGKLNAVSFSPEDVFIFKDSPSIRRSFLDKELCSLFPIFIKQLVNSKNVLEQRNNLLKGKIDENLLDVLDEKLIESSYDIYKGRKWLIGKINEIAIDIYKKITNEKQNISIIYKTFLDEMDKDTYLEKGRSIYKSHRLKDIEKGYSLVGIHKDDFVVFLNGKEVDMYASQGQQRLISLTMKLAICEIVSKTSKIEPIIILDDAFSELDANKKANLFNYVSEKKQVFITCTDYKNIVSNIKNNITLIRVKEGKVLERSSI